MKGKYKAFLRNVSGTDDSNRHMIKLPQDVWKELGWEINENLRIDIIKVGLSPHISIAKEEE